MEASGAILLVEVYLPDKALPCGHIDGADRGRHAAAFKGN